VAIWVHFDLAEFVQGSGIFATATADYLRPGSWSPVSSDPISVTSILWRSSVAKIPDLTAILQPPTDSAACTVSIFNELQPKVSFHTFLLGAGGTMYSP